MLAREIQVLEGRQVSRAHRATRVTMGALERPASRVWMGYKEQMDREGLGEPTELRGVKVPGGSRVQPGRGVIREHRGLRVLPVRRARLGLRPSRPKPG